MTVEIIVDNRIRIARSTVSTDCIAALKQEFTHKNAKRESMRFQNIRGWWNEPEKYETFFVEKDSISFPRGGLDRVRAVLAEFDFEWTIEDARSMGAPDVQDTIPDHLLTPYDYQDECIDVMTDKEQCIVKAPTGCGKTVMGFGAIARWKVATLIVVPNSGLLRQWQKRIPTELGIPLEDIGEIRGSKIKLRPITLTMPQSLSRRLADDGGQEIKDYFGAVFCDEAQLFAAETFYASIDPLPARYRIAVSADQTRKDRKEFLIYDLFGGVAKSITRKRLEKKGAIINVEIWVIPTEFRADWYGLPDEDSDGESEEEASEEKKLDFNRLLMEMLRDEERNALVYNVLTGIVQRDKSQVLAFAARREHCLMIDRTLTSQHFRSGFILGGKGDEAEFEKTLSGLANHTLDIGVGTYQAGGTGIDLPHISNGLGVTPIAGNRQFFNQVRGRFARTVKDGTSTKTAARLYYLWDRHVYPSHLKNISKWNDKVFVWTGTSWMPSRHYLETEK